MRAWLEEVKPILLNSHPNPSAPGCSLLLPLTAAATVLVATVQLPETIQTKKKEES